MTIFKTFSSVLIAWSMSPSQKFVQSGMSSVLKKDLLSRLKMISRMMQFLIERRRKNGNNR